MTQSFLCLDGLALGGAARLILHARYTLIRIFTNEFNEPAGQICPKIFESEYTLTRENGMSTSGVKRRAVVEEEFRSQLQRRKDFLSIHLSQAATRPISLVIALTPHEIGSDGYVRTIRFIHPHNGISA